MVLLLETMLAFPDTYAQAGAGEAGLTVTWRHEHGSSHQATAAALLRCYRADSQRIAAQIGARATADPITSHRLWSDWLGSERVRNFAMVAKKQ